MIEEKAAPVSNKKGCLGVIAAIFAFAVIMTFFGSDDEVSNQQSTTSSAQVSQQDQDTESFILNHGKDYQIVLERDLSHGTRSRFSANIISLAAKSKEEVYGTAAKAAKELQVKHRVQVAHVNFLQSSDGPVLLSVLFAPDKMGWQGDKDLGHRFVTE